MHWLSRTTLVLAALGFLSFGVWFLVDPIEPLARIGIQVAGATAGPELRAFYGGLQVALAAWLGWAAWRGVWAVPALWLVLLVNLGLALGRILGAVAESVWTGFFTGALVWELGFAGLALAALVVQHRRDRRGR